MTRKLEVRGVFPPVPTTFDDRGDLALGRYQENIRRLCDAGVHGAVILGSNGEYVYLSEAEKREVIRAGVQAVPAGKFALAGTGCESTRATIALTNEAARMGAHAAMIVSPFYYKPQMDRKTLIKFYTDVADAAEVPIILYSVPKFTGIDLGVDLVAELAQHPNLIGIKDSSGNVIQLSEFLSTTPAGWNVLVGTGSALYAALALGVGGGVLALADVAPAQCVELYNLFNAGKHSGARDLQLRLLPVNKAVTGTYGIPGVKAAMDMLGYYGGPPRAPLSSLGATEKETLRGILNQAGLL